MEIWTSLTIVNKSYIYTNNVNELTIVNKYLDKFTDVKFC